MLVNHIGDLFDCGPLACAKKNAADKGACNKNNRGCGYKRFFEQWVTLFNTALFKLYQTIGNFPNIPGAHQNNNIIGQGVFFNEFRKFGGVRNIIYIIFHSFVYGERKLKRYIRIRFYTLFSSGNFIRIKNNDRMRVIKSACEFIEEQREALVLVGLEDAPEARAGETVFCPLKG